MTYPVIQRSFAAGLALVSTIIAALLFLMAGPVVAQTPELRTLASYPHGNFLENLEVQPDGRVLITNYPTKTIEVLHPDGTVATFAELSAYPLSIISTAEGYLVAASGKSLLAGEDVTGTQQFLLLDKSGTEVDKFAAPQALYLNGMVRLDEDTVLVADSLAETIWEMNTSSLTVAPWIVDSALGVLPDQPIFLPGANGLKMSADGLIVSNTSKETLVLINVGQDGTALGAPQVIAHVGRIDDFWIRDSGAILFTTHSDELRSLSVDGDVEDVIFIGCDGCTAVAPFPLGQDTTFVIINDGNLYEGGDDQATVLSLTLAAQ